MSLSKITRDNTIGEWRLAFNSVVERVEDTGALGDLTNPAPTLVEAINDLWTEIESLQEANSNTAYTNVANEFTLGQTITVGSEADALTTDGVITAESVTTVDSSGSFTIPTKVDIDSSGLTVYGGVGGSGFYGPNGMTYTTSGGGETQVDPAGGFSGSRLIYIPRTDGTIVVAGTSPIEVAAYTGIASFDTSASLTITGTYSWQNNQYIAVCFTDETGDAVFIDYGSVTFANSSNQGAIVSSSLTDYRTWTMPDASGTVAVSASGNIALSADGDISFNNASSIVLENNHSISICENNISGDRVSIDYNTITFVIDSNIGTITPDTLTTTQTWVIPNASGTFAVSASGNIALSAAGNITFTGTLPVTNGGLGFATATQGDIIYASASNTLSKLAKSATTTHALLNTGASNNPAWGQVPLASGVSGTLPIANGGTNATDTPTAGGIAYGTGSAYAVTSASTSGYFWRSGGTGAPTALNLFGTANTWTSYQAFQPTVSADNLIYIGRDGSGVAGRSISFFGVDGATELTPAEPDGTTVLTLPAGLAGTLAITNATNAGAVGYVLTGVAANVNLAASTTYYFGSLAGFSPSTTADIQRIYIPRSGTIHAAYLVSYAGTTAGTGESWTNYIRHNNTTDYSLGAVASTNASRIWSSTGLSIAVAAGDYIEIKLICPAFTIAPAGIRFGAQIWVTL